MKIGKTKDQETKRNRLQDRNTKGVRHKDDQDN